MTGTREGANDDPNTTTVPENPNATPTRDRPTPTHDSPTAGRHPNIGPPIADEPIAVPQVGSDHVTGGDQPQESNPVTPHNAAPAPARYHDELDNDGHQGDPEDNHLSRPEQHAELGKTDAGSGAQRNAEFSRTATLAEATTAQRRAT